MSAYKLRGSEIPTSIDYSRASPMDIVDVLYANNEEHVPKVPPRPRRQNDDLGRRLQLPLHNPNDMPYGPPKEPKEDKPDRGVTIIEPNVDFYI